MQETKTIDHTIHFLRNGKFEDWQIFPDDKNKKARRNFPAGFWI